VEKWVSTGLFWHEKILYEEHLKRGTLRKVLWFTYGANDAAVHAELLKTGKLHESITVVPMPRAFNSRLGRLIYSFVLPFIHFALLRSVDVLKTNQMDGAWAAIIAKFVAKKPILLRTGYTVTQWIRETNGSRARRVLFTILEWMCYRLCDIGTVASHHNLEYLKANYHLGKMRLHVVPNFVNADLFCPGRVANRRDSFLYVGRLAPDKNPIRLLESAGRIGAEIDYCGDGPQRPVLEQIARSRGIKANFLGRMDHHNLPLIYAQHRFFVLPSETEGSPKALLEAMSCGLICVGTPARGISEIINDGENGFLAQGFGCEALAEAMRRANDHKSEEWIGNNARQTILQNYTIDFCLRQERAIFEAVI